jgi:hypothetical protein
MKPPGRAAEILFSKVRKSLSSYNSSQEVYLFENLGCDLEGLVQRFPRTHQVVDET